MNQLIKMLGVSTCLIGTFVAAMAQAQTPRKLTIISAHDKFDLILNSKTSATVNGKAANLSAFEDLWPVFDNPLSNDCPKFTTKPDVTIKEGAKTRSVYISQGVISDGKGCLTISGEGLAFFPVHRDFLIGPEHDSIKLKSPVKIFRQGVKLLEVKKAYQGAPWSNDSNEILLNWDFIERFENSLGDFKVRLRALPALASGKSKMIVQSGDQAYEFYKVTNVMWAVKKPGSPWLVASDDWSFWYDFDQNLVQDRNSAEIRLLEKASTSKEEKRATLDRLEGLWSQNLREIYHKMLLRSDEDPDFQRIAINRLKRKPSVETAGVMIEFLQRSSDEDLKRIAGQILKVQNPSGPLYKPDLPASEKMKVLEFWNNWWKKNQKPN